MSTLKPPYPNFKRAFFLYILSGLSFFHRLRYDLAKELVIFCSSAILCSLFYYIISDFLKSEIYLLSQSMSESFSLVLALSFLSLVSVFVAFLLAKEKEDKNSYSNMAFMLGEDRGTLKIYHFFKTPSLMLFFFIPTWLLIFLHFYPQLSPNFPYIALTMVLSSYGLSKLKLGYFRSKPLINAEPLNEEHRRPIHSAEKSKVMWILGWKLKTLSRNRIAKFCLLLSLLFSCINAYLHAHHIPFVASLGCSLWVGILAACALAEQSAEDIRCAWMEKNHGVSHEQYLTALRLNVTLVSMGVALIHVLIWLMADLNNLDSLSWFLGLKLFFITSIPGWLLPELIFQIDPRRPLINIITISLASLLLGTALYASWFALGLLPFISHYGNTSQKGRFYRA